MEGLKEDMLLLDTIVGVLFVLFTTFSKKRIILSSAIVLSFDVVFALINIPLCFVRRANCVACRVIDYCGHQ